MVFLSIRLERGGLSPSFFRYKYHPQHLHSSTTRSSTNSFSSLRVAQATMSDTAGQVIKCKAAISWEAGKPLVIEEVEVAPPLANEVRILFTSLCDTDVYFWEAKGQKPAFPWIFDHEGAGVVEGVTDLKPEDPVLPVFTGE